MTNYNLPELSFAIKDALVIEQEIIAKYEELSNRKLADADPVRIFLKVIIYYLIQQRQIIDHTGKQNLLSYATGLNLDFIGMLLGVKRNPSKAASTIIKFSLSAAQTNVITIPAGTRVTRDSNIIFQTTQVAEIKSGDTEINVSATCLTLGNIGNNIKINELNILIDPIAFVAMVTNITDTTGGINEEDDESFKLRIQEAPDKFSNAGSTGSYKYWTRTFSQKIIDVSVFSPSAGVVNVLPLMLGGELPAQAELDGIATILTDSKVRPLTDCVKVLAPTQIDYQIDLTYYIRASDSVSANHIQDMVNKIIQEYIIWQKAKIGRDINPSELIARIIQAGAKRVSLISPVDRFLHNNEVAQDIKINVVYGGLEMGD